MTFQDILLDAETDDLIIKNGDFYIGDSKQQEVNLLINTSIGNWFQYPTIGVGIINYLAGNISARQIEQAIELQLKNDGFIIEDINIEGSTYNNLKINVTAHR